MDLHTSEKVRRRDSRCWRSQGKLRLALCSSSRYIYSTLFTTCLHLAIIFVELVVERQVIFSFVFQVWNEREKNKKNKGWTSGGRWLNSILQPKRYSSPATFPLFARRFRSVKGKRAFRQQQQQKNEVEEEEKTTVWNKMRNFHFPSEFSPVFFSRFYGQRAFCGSPVSFTCRWTGYVVPYTWRCRRQISNASTTASYWTVAFFSVLRLEWQSWSFRFFFPMRNRK